MTEALSRNGQPSPYVKGDVIDGKYRVAGILGEGSFGWVYMCTNVRVHALTYAVKVLKAEHTTDVETVARFHREAETVASLKSKHSVRVTDYGVAGEGLPYIVMEFVDGLSIGEMLNRGGPFDDAEVLELALHILRALDEAHRCGIVHRDLKPDNVIVVQDPDTKRPVARVLDFGLAKILEPENFQVRPEETAAGLVLCTARYAAPDLLKGRPSAQSDIYALGISMIEMIDGRPPYRGEDFYTVAAKHIDPTPVPIGERVKASSLRAIIEKATEKPLDRRYETALEMIADIESLQQKLRAEAGATYHESVSASVRARFEPTSPGVMMRATRRRTLTTAAVLAAMLGAAAAMAIALSAEEPVHESELPLPPPPERPIGTDPAHVEEFVRRQAVYEARFTSQRAAGIARAMGAASAASAGSDGPAAVEADADVPSADDGADAANGAPERTPASSERRDTNRSPSPEDPERSERGPERNTDPASPSDRDSGTGDAGNIFGGIRTIGGP